MFLLRKQKSMFQTEKKQKKVLESEFKQSIGRVLDPSECVENLQITPSLHFQLLNQKAE